MAATDLAPWLPTPARHRAAPVPSRWTSLHVAMRDGVLVAVDVHLPIDRRPSARLPTILRQTRYHRSPQLRPPFERTPLARLLDDVAELRQRFVAAGYAWVDVCARGSGASTGQRPCPWSADEIADGHEIVSWIVAQPWSDGTVGATGVSYDGTASEFLLVAGHPAVRAVAPRFSLFDAYADVAFPGGIHHAVFTAQWSAFNRALDDNALDQAIARYLRRQLRALGSLRPAEQHGVREQLWRLGDTPTAGRLAAWLMRRVATGVRPVDDDVDRSSLAQAVAAHRDNVDIHASALRLECRDDTGLSGELADRSIDAFSPHAHLAELRSSRAAIYSYSGWLDGGYAHSAIKRFLTLRDERSRLVLGPWDHGGRHNVSPYSPPARAAFDHSGELLQFFDEHLRGRSGPGRPPVSYFTVGQERWKTSFDWPPPGGRVEPWYLGPGHTLGREPAPRPGIDEYRIDPTVGTGHRSRWDSLLGLLVPAGYPDRAASDRRLLVYRSRPLTEPLEITGHPIVTLWVHVDCRDISLFAYLEDETPDGRVVLMTEGMLRAAHRRLVDAEPPYHSPAPYRSFTRAALAPLDPGEPAELRFDLLPLSWELRRGHRLRLALAGADCDHFEPPDELATMAVHHGANPRASFIELPVVPT